MDVEPSPRATILEMNPDGSMLRPFATGVRNPVGLTFRPGTNELWASVHERDMLGDDLVPDYVSRIQDGGFYGWPFAYTGPNEDPRRKGERPDLVAKAIVPDVLLQSHSAPLGLAFYTGTQFPAEYRGDAFLALHGSWNRKQRTGYKVVRIPIRDGKPTGAYEDFIVGWSPADDRPDVWGRPVAILPLSDGSLLVTDDAHNVIWRVTLYEVRCNSIRITQIDRAGLSGTIAACVASVQLRRCAARGSSAPRSPPPPEGAPTTPALRRLLDDGGQVERVATNFQFADGPIWIDGALVFTDAPRGQLLRWRVGEEPAVIAEDSGGASGLAIDASRRLIAAEHDRKRVSRREDGEVASVVERVGDTALERADRHRHRARWHAVRRRSRRQPATEPERQAG